jgi:anti-anti-sigma factor
MVVSETIVMGGGDVPGQRMEMRASSQGEVLILELQGRLTGASDAGRLVESTERHAAQGHKLFLFDLEGISWVDSTGIGALVSAFESVRRVGGTARFAGLNDRLQRIMEITKLDRVLEISTTRAEALESFGGAGAGETDEDRSAES